MATGREAYAAVPCDCIESEIDASSENNTAIEDGINRFIEKCSEEVKSHQIARGDRLTDYRVKIRNDIAEILEKKLSNNLDRINLALLDCFRNRRRQL